MSPDFLTPSQLVARWGGAVTLGTLSNWRSQGKGPAYVKLGAGVRYPLAAVVAFENSNTVRPGAHASGSAAT